MNLQIVLSLVCMFTLIFYIYKNNLENKDFELVRLTTIDSKAYWMYNNKLYRSDIVNGKVIDSKKEEVDSMNMSEQDIHELLEMMNTK